MYRKVIVAFLTIFCLGTLFGYIISYRLNSFSVEPQASLVYDPLIAEMISTIKETDIYDSVYRLQNFTTRRYGTPGNMEAGGYLFSELSKIPRVNVEYQGGDLRNIIATLNGTDATSTAIYIVGAHYDSISLDSSDAPGATDNGGGVAIVLELARIMSNYEFRHTLKFAFWNDEEDGVVGSANYAQYALSSSMNLSFYFNFDSTCYDPNNRTILDIMYNPQSAWISDLMTQSNTLYGIGFTLTYNIHSSCTSDHNPFWDRGYTAVMTHAEEHGPAHTHEDTIDKVSTLYAKKNGQLGMSVLAELAEVQGPWIPPDTETPHISILSPTNKTYSTHSLSLTFTLNESASWMGYSLDNEDNVTTSGNTTLTDLSNGVHTIVVYANDTAANMGQSNIVHFTVDTVHPAITVLSPENKTYATNMVPLNLKANKPTSWIGYSLDNQENVTISGNVTLTGLSDRAHTIVVYANDTAGNVGQSDMVHFTVDTTTPAIQVLSPENKTYAESSVPLNFNVNKATSWMSYSLDNQMNTSIVGNLTLVNLSEGSHIIKVYVNDTVGNMGQSDTVYFTVDTVHPSITVLSPENKRYAADSVFLKFNVSKLTSWMGYSLDGQINATIGGNVTLVGLSEGSHTIRVYANDTNGLMGCSDTVYFVVDTIPCEIGILSPQNKTYSTTSVALDFTVNELTSWIAYNLDDRANMTVTGNVTLSELPDGSHNIIVYAKDVAGNIGASVMIYFSVNAQNIQKEEPFVPTFELYIGVTLAIVGVAVTGLVLYMKKKPRKTGPSTSKHE